MELCTFKEFHESAFFVHCSVSDACPGMQQGSKIRGGGQVVLGGDNVSPLVEIGLTDPPKSGGAAAPLPPTLLHACVYIRRFIFIFRLRCSSMKAASKYVQSNLTLRNS